MAQPLIVSGPPRCGTTILGMILQSHPDIALTLENDLACIATSLHAAFAKMREHHTFLEQTRLPAPISRPLARPVLPGGKVGGGKVGEGKVARPQSAEARFAALTEQRNAGFLHRVALPHGPDSLDERMQRVLQDFFAVNCGKTDFAWFGDKMPLAHRKTDLAALDRIGIDPAWIFIFRDPRGMVASSNRRWAETQAGRDQWTIASVREAIAVWADAWSFAHRLVAAGKRVLLLKYRDLLHAPRRELARISQFLGISADWPDFQLFDTPDDINRAFLPSAEEAMVKLRLGEICDNWDMPITELIGTPISYTPLAGDRLDFTRLDEFEQLMLGQGIHAPDDWCRWTAGRGEISFRLPEERRPARLVLSCGAVPSTAAQATIGIAVNGAAPLAFAASRLDASCGGGVISLDLPPDAGRIDLAISTSHPQAPQPGGDNRELGLALREISFLG